MLENSLTGEPPSCGVSELGRLDTTIRQVAHPSSYANLDKSDASAAWAGFGRVSKKQWLLLIVTMFGVVTIAAFGLGMHRCFPGSGLITWVATYSDGLPFAHSEWWEVGELFNYDWLKWLQFYDCNITSLNEVWVLLGSLTSFWIFLFNYFNHFSVHVSHSPWSTIYIDLPAH